MEKEAFELEEFINSVIEIEDHKINSSLQSMQFAQISQQNWIQLRQKQIQIDAVPQQNQFLSFRQDKNQYGIDLTSNSNSSQKPRKKRIYLDINMIEQMNLAFNKLHQNDNSGFKNQLTLKKIAEKLNLSYLTVMKKYKQFKKYKMVLKGAKLEASKNRSYKKTQEMYQIIQQCMKQRKFVSASQLGNYMKNQYGKYFSRFQIRSCMKKIKQKQSLLDNTDQESKKNQIYKNYLNLIEDNTVILFFAELEYFTKDLTSITISLMSGQKGLQFLVQSNAQDKIFHYLLGLYYSKYDKFENYVIVTGNNEIDRRKIKQASSSKQEESLFQQIDQMKVKYYCLPHGFETLNLAKNILIRNSVQSYKPQQFFLQEITAKLSAEKKNYSIKSFLSFTTQLTNKTVIGLNQKYS